MVALRSFRRRYRALVAGLDPDDRRRLLTSGSPSALDAMRAAARALDAPLASEDPETVADAVGEAAEAKAAEAERRSGDEWKDQVLLDRLREDVHAGIHQLREAERAVEAARRDGR